MHSNKSAVAEMLTGDKTCSIEREQPLLLILFLKKKRQRDNKEKKKG